MLIEVETEYGQKLQANRGSYYYYNMENKEMREYFQELYDLGKCKPFPPVIFDVYESTHKYRLVDYQNYRSQEYEVIDDYTYTVHSNIKTSHVVEEGEKDGVSHQ